MGRKWELIDVVCFLPLQFVKCSSIEEAWSKCWIIFRDIQELRFYSYIWRVCMYSRAVLCILLHKPHIYQYFKCVWKQSWFFFFNTNIVININCNSDWLVLYVFDSSMLNKIRQCTSFPIYSKMFTISNDELHVLINSGDGYFLIGTVYWHEWGLLRNITWQVQ